MHACHDGKRRLLSCEEMPADANFTSEHFLSDVQSAAQWQTREQAVNAKA